MEGTEVSEGPQGTPSTLCDLPQSFAWDLNVALSIMGSAPPGSVLGVPSEARGQMGVGHSPRTPGLVARGGSWSRVNQAAVVF